MTQTDTHLRVALAQITPALLDRDATIERVVRAIDEAHAGGASLVAFGEALVPGYPVWLSRAGGAKFDDPLQKAIHARYVREAVDIEAGDLKRVQEACARSREWAVLGVLERPADRGQSLYCSCVTIDGAGAVRSVHRKLMPTYEERLAWAVGDGHGLVTHPLGPFTLGSLNCWENWMPLARHALQAQGETLHVAIWPGSDALTRDITRFAAREGRSYVLSASGLFRASDLPEDVPELRDAREAILADPDDAFNNGGSCVAGPDGKWVLEPVVGEEGVFFADLDAARVRAERQNFDPSGHYARPEVLGLTLDRSRQSVLRDP